MAEDNAEDHKVSGFAWFLAGLGAGALAGVLYAPKSGRETRDAIASNAREGKEYLRNRSKQVTERVGILVGRGKEQVSQYIDRGQAQWKDFVERGKNLVDQQQSRVAAAVEAGRQAYKAGTSSANSVAEDHS